MHNFNDLLHDLPNEHIEKMLHNALLQALLQNYLPHRHGLFSHVRNGKAHDLLHSPLKEDRRPWR